MDPGRAIEERNRLLQPGKLAPASAEEWSTPEEDTPNAAVDVASSSTSSSSRAVGRCVSRAGALGTSHQVCLKRNQIFVTFQLVVARVTAGGSDVGMMLCFIFPDPIKND